MVVTRKAPQFGLHRVGRPSSLTIYGADFNTACGTQIKGVDIAVYGLLMPAIGWKRALLIWGHALIGFVINDRVKLLGYRILDPEGEQVIARRSASAMQAVS